MSSVSDDSASLRVPKHSVRVTVGLLGRKPRALDVFLAEHKSHAFSPQDVLDLLNEDATFLPGTAPNEKVWVTFNKNSVLWLAVPPTDNEELDLFDQRKQVHVEFVDGSHLAGELMYSPAEGRARVVDHLNNPGDFFHLFHEGDTYLVNKSFVLGISEAPIAKD